MAVRQLSLSLDPFLVASVGTEIVEGDDNTAADPGVRRVADQLNFSAGYTPEQHICMTFGGDGFDGGNELRTIGPMLFPGVGSDETLIRTDYRPRMEFPTTRFGFTVIGSGGVSVSFEVTLVDEALNSMSFVHTVLLAAFGTHSTVDINLLAGGLIMTGGWVSIEVEFRNNAPGSTAQCRMFRVVDRPVTTGFPEPPNT